MFFMHQYCLVLVKGSLEVSFFKKRKDREMGKSFVRFWVLVPLRLMVQWNQYFAT